MSSMMSAERAARFQCEFGLLESLGQVIIWILLTIITLGLALFVFPYYFNKVVLNRTQVLDAHDRPIGRLDCQFSLGHSIGHVILWAVLILLTFGIAAFFYAYRILRVLLNDTRIVYF
jgi:hypothetical protein